MCTAQFINEYIYLEVSKGNDYQYTWGPNFMKAFNLEEFIQNVQPDGYIVRLRLFVRAPSNVQIRFGETEFNSCARWRQ